VFALLSAGVIVVVLVAVLVGRSADPHQHASTSTSVPTSIATSSSTATSTSLAVDTTSQIVRLLDPAVVDINTINQTDTGYAIAAATGMIVSSNGYIVTNNHVVEEATSIKVAIDGHASQYAATFVGANPAADVAVIKVVGLTGLPTVHFGNSSMISVGDQVVALGNAHGRGGPPAVTTGKIAALGRSISASSDITGKSENLTGMIETNATIVAGNSGGPLVDGQSDVIGMNTAANPGGTFGFAMPINRVSTIATAIEQGRTGGGIVLGLRAFLGVVGKPPKSGTASDGVDITRIVLGDPAAAGGVEPGDVIVDFDGKPTPTVSVLLRLVLALRPGDVATVTFDSPNGLATSSVTLIAGPAP
jgi:S1-C subfamily serine protease